MSRIRIGIAVAFILGIVMVGPARAELINVKFQLDYDPYGFNTNYSGQGVLSDPGNNTWNNIGLPTRVASFYNWSVGCAASITVPTTINNLVDSAGNVTDVSITIEGDSSTRVFDAGAYNLGNFAIDPSGGKSLMRDMLVTDNSAEVVISGLTPNGTYNLVTFGAGDNGARDTTFTVDGVTQSTVQGDRSLHPYLTEGFDYVVFSNVQADATGQLVVTFSRGINNGEADFNAFQLEGVAVPEPSTGLLLSCLSIVGLGFGWRNRMLRGKR